MTVDVLANPAWHALGGERVAEAETVGRARRYQPDVSPFAGLPDEPDTDDWDALRALVGPNSVALLIREHVEIPTGWEETFRLAGVQMVAAERVDGHGMNLDPAKLRAADVPEMLELVERTQPGPFLPATIRLGTYLGVRVDGALVAMAGERMRPPGYTEVSAVCTDAGFRGRGLAAGLVRAVMRLIDARGERPMLHAAADNTSAVRLYESLGFRRTRDMVGVALRAPA
jgi:ribosomal protein S18 acetylase RimI-like enzyme